MHLSCNSLWRLVSALPGVDSIHSWLTPECSTRSASVELASRSTGSIRECAIGVGVESTGIKVSLGAGDLARISGTAPDEVSAIATRPPSASRWTARRKCLSSEQSVVHGYSPCVDGVIWALGFCNRRTRSVQVVRSLGSGQWILKSTRKPCKQ